MLEALGLAAGLGVFLWGMTHLEDAIKRLSGGTLDRWLHELAERLRRQRLDAWQASSLMNGLHQASRLPEALSPPDATD